MKRIFFLTFVVALGLPATLGPAARATPVAGMDHVGPHWTQETAWLPTAIDTEVNAAAMAVGSDGTVHLAYARLGTLWYARTSGGGWSRSPVTVGSKTVEYVRDVELDLDPRGEPCIATSDGMQVTYLSREADSWHLAVVVPRSRASIGDIVMRRTPDGEPQVLYHVYVIDEGDPPIVSNLVRLARHGLHGWALVPLYSDTKRPDHAEESHLAMAALRSGDVLAALSLDSSLSHFLVRKSSAGPLKAMDRVGPDDTALAEAGDGSIVECSVDTPFGVMTSTLVCKRFTSVGQKLDASTVETAPYRDFRGGPALVLDAAGDSHLAYAVRDAEAATVEIRHAHRVDGSWRIEPVATAAADDYPVPRLAVGPDGQPQLAFIGDGTLYHMRPDVPASPTPSPTDTVPATSTPVATNAGSATATASPTQLLPTASPTPWPSSVPTVAPRPVLLPWADR